jgi:hypothetical protein
MARLMHSHFHILLLFISILCGFYQQIYWAVANNADVPVRNVRAELPRVLLPQFSSRPRATIPVRLDLSSLLQGRDFTRIPLLFSTSLTDLVTCGTEAHEKNFSAQQPEAQAHSRLPRADGYP